ncbi:hypothetical protein GCM10010329_76550 [Streptomyces spiroverticillatus]|uniref:Tetratricopeptide repeat protein n=1 Tax=Streptomyces finlayi TaxID=67296 RepID=A0A918X7L1_9ACTN|nr:tetratricopeptide repeat protein [Streptomyces finlayi]GHA42248.1 hypothetical protein GCM10010329_76550 [Streptomyces spiroverticillatus]GHD17109.1 hypothetical protein GCM10010334_78700 [Streptomyces finlayi]
MLDGLLGGAPGTVPLVVVSGTAGVGKTAFAVHWAHRVSARYPEGQLYVDLRGFDLGRPMPWADALAGFLRALGLDGANIPLDPDERAALFRTRTAGRDMLLVLDNALSAEQVRPLLPGSASCAVVVTSRHSLGGLVARNGARRMDLGPLSAGEATALLCLLIGERARADRAACAALAEQCARLPLALRVAAELAVARVGVPLAELVAGLADQRQRLRRLDAAGDPRAAVRSVFSWSYRNLPADAARGFRLLSLHPGPDVGVPATAALLGAGVDEATGVLDVLSQAHLVQCTAPGRVTMHDLLRAYADELSREHDAEAGRLRAHIRLLDHCLAGATAAMDQLHPAERHHRPAAPGPAGPAPVHDPATARAWLAAELPSLGCLCAAAADGLRPQYAVRLAAVLFRHLDGGRHAEALSFHTHALRAAERTRDLAGQAHAVTNLGAVHWRLGEHGAADRYLQRALALHEETGDLAGQARTLSNLGNVHWRLGRHSSAAACQRRALALYEEAGDLVGQARTLTNLGNVCMRRGELDTAADHQHRALALHAVTGDRLGRARTLTFLGNVDLRRGRTGAAAGNLGRAVALFAALGHRGGEANALTGLGDVCLRQGRYDLAVAHHRRALSLFRTTGERSGEAAALNGLGEALCGAGRAEEGLRHHVRAGEVAAATGDHEERARARAGTVRARQQAQDAARTAGRVSAGPVDDVPDQDVQRSGAPPAEPRTAVVDGL